jgi:hypothetical protein
MSTNESGIRRRWPFLLLLLLVIIVLCLVLLVVTGQIPGLGGPSGGRQTEPPDETATFTPIPETDEPTETVTETEKPTETEESGGGACLDSCNPENSNCSGSTSCVKDNLGNFVCWGGTDASGQYCGPTGEDDQSGCACQGTDLYCKNPDGSIASVSYNSAECGGTGLCECRGGDLACPDGTYAQFNPQCTDTSPCTCIYSYAAGGYICAEDGGGCIP